jgi:hypothetical protein
MRNEPSRSYRCADLECGAEDGRQDERRGYLWPGEALEVPAGTVRYRIAMARKRLAELLRLERDVRTKGRT